MDIFRLLFLLLSFIILKQPYIYGWWDEGHMVIAQIAYDDLKPHIQYKVDELIAAVSTPYPNHADFISASTWADDIVNEGVFCFYSWHGSPRPYDPEGILTVEKRHQIIHQIENHDIVWGINECIKTLKTHNATNWAKGFLLRLLIHIVGDIHQPNHCITMYSHNFPHGDRAGTRFKINHPQYTTLHNLFDAGFGWCCNRPSRPMSIGDRMHISELADILTDLFPRDSLMQLSKKNTDSWRQESYDIGVAFVYAGISPFDKPSQQYLERGKLITASQMALAGYRLADLLNSVLDD